MTFLNFSLTDRYAVCNNTFSSRYDFFFNVIDLKEKPDPRTNQRDIIATVTPSYIAINHFLFTTLQEISELSSLLLEFRNFLLNLDEASEGSLICIISKFTESRKQE